MGTVQSKSFLVYRECPPILATTGCHLLEMKSASYWLRRLSGLVLMLSIALPIITTGSCGDKVDSLEPQPSGTTFHGWQLLAQSEGDPHWDAAEEPDSMDTVSENWEPEQAQPIHLQSYLLMLMLCSWVAFQPSDSSREPADRLARAGSRGVLTVAASAAFALLELSLGVFGTLEHGAWAIMSGLWLLLGCTLVDGWPLMARLKREAPSSNHWLKTRIVITLLNLVYLCPFMLVLWVSIDEPAQGVGDTLAALSYPLCLGGVALIIFNQMMRTAIDRVPEDSMRAVWVQWTVPQLLLLAPIAMLFFI